VENKGRENLHIFYTNLKTKTNDVHDQCVDGSEGII